MGICKQRLKAEAVISTGKYQLKYENAEVMENLVNTGKKKRQKTEGEI